MRKGSYSEELVKIVVGRTPPTAMLEASRRRITFRRQHVESRILSPRECEVALFLHNGAAVPVAGLCARFSATLPQSRNCKSLLGSHHEVVRDASVVIETGLARIPDSAPMVTPTP